MQNETLDEQGLQLTGKGERAVQRKPSEARAFLLAPMQHWLLARERGRFRVLLPYVLS